MGVVLGDSGLVIERFWIYCEEVGELTNYMELSPSGT
jgi:hypothetical protein